jgi:hypothetical protein
MRIIWDISEEDINRLKAYVEERRSLIIDNRTDRNINRNNIVTDRDAVIKSLLACLMTPAKRTDIDKRAAALLNREPFPLSHRLLENETNLKGILTDLLRENGLSGHIDSVPDWFTASYINLENSEWELVDELDSWAGNPPGKSVERELADRIDRMFKGFGSSRSRIFLLNLGISRYELPIDLLTIKWLREFGFPVSFSLKALQDIHFYHMVSDGIQLLCEKAGIFPAVLDAAIISENLDPAAMKYYIIN